MASGRLLDILMSNIVSYEASDVGVVPDDLQTSSISFGFNGNTTDIVNHGDYNDYTICFYHNQQYKSVGSFSKGEMQLDITRMEQLSAMVTPTSVCAGRCDSCLDDGQIPIIFLKGDVYIAGVFSIHESDLFECGPWRTLGHDAFQAEGFIFAIHELRKLTGIKFGAIGFDDCYSPLRITSLLTDFMSNINPSNEDLFPHHVPRDKIVGVIGCRSSGCTLATTAVFMPLGIPVISYAASSPDLDDKVNYPYFLRTVPSDVFQAQVMVSIIRKMDWNYVGLLYVKNNYGSKGMLAFRQIVDQEGSGICVPQEFGISEENNEENDKIDFFNAYMHFRQQGVKVVVFFGIDERFRSFLKIMEKNEHYGDFIFLASEEWGNNRRILDDGEKSARGSITLKLQNVGLPFEQPFKEHLRVKKPSDSDDNIWFKEFWQNTFKCNFKGGLINNYQSECLANQGLSNAQIDEYVGEQRLSHVMSAVVALGKGYKELETNNDCDGPLPCEDTPEAIVKKIMKQTLETDQQSRFVFDDAGNGAIGFDVFNVQTSDGGKSYEYEKVGTFFGPESNDMDITKLKFYDEKGNTIAMEAKCSDGQCDVCKHRAVTIDPGPKESKDNEDFSDPDILIISLIVLLILALAVVVAALFICMGRKYKVIEKKLDVNEDQTYAEPERVVYAGPDNTCRNQLIFSDPNVSPYQDSTFHTNSNQSGINNPAYSPESDNIDSVSQVITMRRRNQSDANLSNLHSHSTSDLPSQRNVHDQTQNALSGVPHYNSHPMPSTFIGRSNNSNSSGLDGNPQENASLANSYISRIPASEADLHRSVNPNHISFISAPAAVQNPISNGVVMTVPYSFSSENNSSNEPAEGDQIIYYIQDSQGQLRALVPPQSLPRTSVKSDASSSVVAEHGPYSDALAQKKLQQKNQMQLPVAHSHYVSTNMIAIPWSNRTPHEVIELKDMGMPQAHPRPSQVQQIVDSPLSNGSPIHYASPVHAPVSHTAMLHQPTYPVMAENQEPGLNAVDPGGRAMGQNHVGQTNFPPNHAPQYNYVHGMPGEDNTMHGDVFSKHDANPHGDLEREEAYRHISDQPTSFPDVIATGLSPMSLAPTGGHMRNPSDPDVKSEHLDEKSMDIKFHQTLPEQQVVSDV